MGRAIPAAFPRGPCTRSTPRPTVCAISTGGAQCLRGPPLGKRGLGGRAAALIASGPRRPSRRGSCDALVALNLCRALPAQVAIDPGNDLLVALHLVGRLYLAADRDLGELTA